MTIYPTTRTGTQVANYIKRQFGDEAGVQLTNSDLLAWINSGQIEICDRNKALKALATTDVVAGQADYTLTGLNVMQIESIHYNSGVLPGQDFAQAQKTINDSTGGTGATDLLTVPVLWYLWGGVITLWPTPTDNLTGGLKIYYTKMPTDLTDLTQTLSIPDKYYNALTSWVMSKAYELDESFAEADAQLQYFERALDNRNEEERSAQQVTYPVITIVE